jgi:hypothetical protein
VLELPEVGHSVIREVPEVFSSSKYVAFEPESTKLSLND